MATVTLNLNAAATALVGSKTRARVRVLENGVVEIRPTKRTTGETLLPENESMRAISRKNKSTVKLNVRGVDLEAGTKMKVTPLKYKWLRLEPMKADELNINEPFASVAAA